MSRSIRSRCICLPVAILALATNASAISANDVWSGEFVFINNAEARSIQLIECPNHAFGSKEDGLKVLQDRVQRQTDYEKAFGQLCVCDQMASLEMYSPYLDIIGINPFTQLSPQRAHAFSDSTRPSAWEGSNNPILLRMNKMRKLAGNTRLLARIATTGKESDYITKRQPSMEEIRWFVYAAIGSGFTGVIWVNGFDDANPALVKMRDELLAYAPELGTAKPGPWISAPKGQPVSLLCSNQKLFVVLLNPHYFNNAKRLTNRKALPLPLLDPMINTEVTLTLPESVVVASAQTLAGQTLPFTRIAEDVHIKTSYHGGGQILVVDIRGQMPSVDEQSTREPDLELVADSQTSEDSNANLKANEAAAKVWKNGLPSDPSFFPIGVWGQSARDVRRYRNIGINLYVSLNSGPTTSQLNTLRKHGMQAICHQNQAGLRHVNDPDSDPIIVGWMHSDEPDNHKRDLRTGEWVPAKSTKDTLSEYKRIRKADSTRPILLNLGQGVANPEYIGSWAKPDDYRQFVKAGDIISFDIYPACSLLKEVTGKLWLVAAGIDKLHDYGNGKKILWNVLETTAIKPGSPKITPHELRAEVWMSLIHGSNGIIYFCHEFRPDKTIVNSLLRDKPMAEAVGQINRQIHALAPVLNSPTIANVTTVTSSNAEIPVDIMTKRHGNATYIFAVAMRPGETDATFTVQGIPADASVEIIGENRTLTAHGGTFTDTFGRFDVHLYRIDSAGGN